MATGCGPAPDTKAEEPTTTDPGAPASSAESSRAARRRTRVLELYDPGIRYVPVTRQDRSVERAAGRSTGPPGRTEEGSSTAVAPATPTPRPSPQAEPERGIWLDILYGTDEAPTGGEGSTEDPLASLFGDSPENIGLPAPAARLDPYEQMLSSYRQFLESEDQKVEQQLRDDTMGQTPFEPQSDLEYAVDPRAVEQILDDDFTALLQEALPGTADSLLQSRVIDDLPSVSQQTIAPMLSDSDLSGDLDADDWTTRSWRNLFENLGTDTASEDLPPDGMDAAGFSDLPLPVNRGSEEHDFAGLTAIRRGLMAFRPEDEEPATFAPVEVRAGWQAEPTADFVSGMESGFEADAGSPFDRTLRPGARSEPGIRPSEDGMWASPFGREEGGGFTDTLRTDAAEPGASPWGAASGFGARGRDSLYDGRSAPDPFSPRSPFNLDDDWGSLGR